MVSYRPTWRLGELVERSCSLAAISTSKEPLHSRVLFDFMALRYAALTTTLSHVSALHSNTKVKAKD